MTNPRQRRKNRSASYKAVSHSRFAKTKLKKTPPIRGPKVLQDNWDPKKTVKQNYAALGLALGLTPYASGGIEKDKELIPSSVASTSQQTLDELPTTPASLPAGYGRIIRDDEGNVIGIEMPEAESDDQLNTPDAPMDMEALEPQLDPATLDKWASHMGHSTHDNESASNDTTNVVKELDRISTRPTAGSGNTLNLTYSGVGARHASEGEKHYLQRLVDKHGDNVEKMAQDRRLNPSQSTVGQLRKALKRAGLIS